MGADESAGRRRLRTSFNTQAELYDRARPTYPDVLFDDMVTLAALKPLSRLLEVGCGTGQATIPLARRGYAITCLELGRELAQLAARNLSTFPNVSVINTSLEDWRPRTKDVFDLVFAATAWHWIDPEVRYAKAHACLRTNGYLAVWSAAHVFPAGGDPFFREIQDVYDEIGEGKDVDTLWPTPDQLEDSGREIEATGLFTDVAVRRYDWEVEYDADSYIDLLSTFSGHIAMEGWKRGRLNSEIRRRLAQRPSASLHRHWGVVLNVARKQAE